MSPGVPYDLINAHKQYMERCKQQQQEYGYISEEQFERLRHTQQRQQQMGINPQWGSYLSGLTYLPEARCYSFNCRELTFKEKLQKDIDVWLKDTMA